MSTWLHAATAKHPDRIAIEGRERSLTYAELREAAVAGANGLNRARRVALALPPGEEFVIALHACLVAGAAAVPVDLRLSQAEQEQRLAGADVVLRAPLSSSRSLAGRPASHEGRRAEDPHEAEEPREGRGEGDPSAAVAVMHTSGTTAAPKPVVLTRANFEASALGSAVALGLDPGERWLCPMPLTHVGGLSIPIRSAIYATTAVLHGRFDTEAVLAELMDSGRRITLVSLVPTMLARLLDAGLEHPPALRWALLGGGPIASALLERARDAAVPVAPTYGMTEACSQIATFGWPLTGVALVIGEDEEVLVRGPIVAPGAVSGDGWLHTGDLGRFDERGRLEIAGRKADTIITGGENVAPSEVEAALLEHPAVAEAAVHPRPEPEWGEAVVATVVLRNGRSVGPDGFREFCAARLAPFKVPKSVAFADRLPRTVSGKLLRRQLNRGVSSPSEIAASDSPNQLTIEQLAAQSGMSVRNIRAHQARGLLDPPEVRARVGYYGPEHVEQLRLIRDLQEDGFNLGAIKRLRDDTPGTAARLRRFGEALSAVAAREAGETLTLEELGRRFHVSAEEAPEVLAEAERLGVLVPIGDGRYRAPSPSLLAIGQEVVARGISVRSALAVLEDIDRHCDSVSRSFVEVFVHEIWKPFAQADMPAERWPEIEHAVERLGPVASEALMAIFQRRLGAQLEGAFEEITRRVAKQRSADQDGD